MAAQAPAFERCEVGVEGFSSQLAMRGRVEKAWQHGPSRTWLIVALLEIPFRVRSFLIKFGESEAKGCYCIMCATYIIHLVIPLLGLPYTTSGSL